MRVHARVAVAWKVLNRTQNAAVLHTFHVSVGFFVNLLRVFAERPKINDGIIGVVVHIYRRRKIDVNTQPTLLGGNGAAHFINQIVVALHGSHRHLVRKPHGAVEAHGQAPLGVHCYQKRHFGDRVVVISQLRLLHGATLKENNAAHFIIANVLRHHARVGKSSINNNALWVHGVGVGGYHDELRDALVGREGIENRIYPTLIGVLQKGWGSLGYRRMRNGKYEM